MNTEIILVAIIFILCGLIGWKEREGRLERNKLINALLAKNATEMANLDLVDKTEIKVKQPEEGSLPNYIPPENLSQEDWEKVVTNG